MFVCNALRRVDMPSTMHIWSRWSGPFVYPIQELMQLSSNISHNIHYPRSLDCINEVFRGWVSRVPPIVKRLNHKMWIDELQQKLQATPWNLDDVYTMPRYDLDIVEKQLKHLIDNLLTSSKSVKKYYQHSIQTVSRDCLNIVKTTSRYDLDIV
jgi:hypothetical protein